MKTLFADLWASLQIFYSNFNARFGRLFNAVIVLGILALCLYALLRALLAGRKGRRSPSPLTTHKPDPQVTRHAAESLSMAIRIPSVTGDKAHIRAMTGFLRERYPKAMEVMDCATLPDGSMLLRWCSTQISDQNPVLFCGHLDVVPGGEGWTVCEPFEGFRQDGCVYGRGALDSKGVVIGLMEAAENLIREGHTPRRDVYFAFGADEETGGKKGAKAIGEILAQQGLRFDLVLDEGCTFQEMECDGRTYSAAMIGMGEKQQCEYLLTARCVGGHTSQPGRSTAVGILSEAICRIESAQPHHRLTPLVRQHLDQAISTFTFGKRFVVANKPLFGLLVSLVFKDDPYVMSLIRTTIVPTRVEGNFPASNVLPGTASAYLNARLLPGDTPEKILGDLQELLADLPVDVELVSEWEPSGVTSEEEPMYKLLRDVIQQAHPRLPCIPTLMNSTGDARHYSELSDCILRFSPLVTGKNAGGGSHEADEFLAEDSLGVAVELYQDLMRKL